MSLAGMQLDIKSLCLKEHKKLAIFILFLSSFSDPDESLHILVVQ